MATSPWSGTLVDAAGRRYQGRVVGVGADGSARAVTESDDNGCWHLPADSTLTMFVGVRTRDGIAATRTAAASGTTLVLPETMTCRFEFDCAAPYTQLWLDPLRIDGFDDTLLLALRAGPSGSIVLHVGSFEAAGGALTLELQPGRYRLSGGRIAIHPALGMDSEGLMVGEVVDLVGGQPLARQDGDWLLHIRQPGHYRVRYEVAP